MNFQALREYCLQQKGTIEDFPFGPQPHVMKVANKMFALLSNEDEVPTISLKCDPVRSDVLRDTYPAVKPGYHLNKKHWNTVIIDGSIPDEEIMSYIDHSYELVFKGLRKSEREQIQ
ncbi:MmcQ/YjbR family DNA-binding protein [Ectobacillus polymachus]|uniref:MmcQ/YjbR family DNA-binding protein n=1 Tax=Ectobacillus polymachus TaxID=1508806 RepID=UPI003A86F7F0